jgi:hypothetical protein
MQSVTLDVQEIKSRLTRRLGVRGIVAIAFGIVMLVWPGPTVVALTYLFGAMAGADGLLAISPRPPTPAERIGGGWASPALSASSPPSPRSPGRP